MSTSKKVLFCILVFIGLLNSIGYLINSTILRGIAAATCSSPLPLVFTNVKGVDTYALDFKITVFSKNCNENVYTITPQLYSQLKGPYNRRNVYGAAFSYAPILNDSLRNAVLHYGLCGSGVLLKEMGIIDIPEKIRISITQKSKTEINNRNWTYNYNCNQ